MYLFLCVYSSVLLHICVCTTGTASEARREYCIPGTGVTLGYELLWVLGTESMSPERALNVHNHCNQSLQYQNLNYYQIPNWIKFANFLSDQEEKLSSNINSVNKLI